MCPHFANIAIILMKKFRIFIGAVFMSMIFLMRPFYIYVALV